MMGLPEDIGADVARFLTEVYLEISTLEKDLM